MFVTRRVNPSQRPKQVTSKFPFSLGKNHNTFQLLPFANFGSPVATWTNGVERKLQKAHVLWGRPVENWTIRQFLNKRHKINTLLEYTHGIGPRYNRHDYAYRVNYGASVFLCYRNYVCIYKYDISSIIHLHLVVELLFPCNKVKHIEPSKKQMPTINTERSCLWSKWHFWVIGGTDIWHSRHLEWKYAGHPNSSKHHLPPVISH